MSQRHALRGACRALSSAFAGGGAAASSHGSSAGAMMRSAIGRLHAGPVSAIGLAATCHGVRASPGFQAASGLRSPAPMMGFAASAPSVTGALAVAGSVVQRRSASTTDLAEDGDGDDADPTYLRRVDPQSSLLRSPEDDKPPDLQAPRRQRGGGGGPRREEGDPLELALAAREAYTRPPDGAQGGLALPASVREALYGHHWDRLIVDVRRLPERVRGGAKVETYTAMVATGNTKGLFGLGVGVAETAALASARAHLDSYTRLVAVPLYRGHTLYHHVDHTFHHMRIRVMPRPEGWGLVASDFVYELASLVGLRNASIKLRGRRGNRFYVAQAFQEALLQQTVPHDGVEATGVYVREVFRGARHRGGADALPLGMRRGVEVM